eukprot:624560_1
MYIGQRLSSVKRDNNSYLIRFRNGLWAAVGKIYANLKGINNSSINSLWSTILFRCHCSQRENGSCVKDLSLLNPPKILPLFPSENPSISPIKSPTLYSSNQSTLKPSKTPTINPTQIPSESDMTCNSIIAILNITYLQKMQKF